MLLKGVTEAQFADETLCLLYIALYSGGLGTCNEAYMVVYT